MSSRIARKTSWTHHWARVAAAHNVLGAGGGDCVSRGRDSEMPDCRISRHSDGGVSIGESLRRCGAEVSDERGRGGGGGENGTY